MPITGRRSQLKIEILRLKWHFESRAEGFLLRYLLENCTAVSAHETENGSEDLVFGLFFQIWRS
jgi:hypothetical protein